jgi:hypothetical protein
MQILHEQQVEPLGPIAVDVPLYSSHELRC